MLSCILTLFIRVFWIGSCAVLTCKAGSVMPISSNHAHVRLRFKLAAGLGESRTRDGSVPQGCPLSMMIIVALYLSWCRYLAAQEGVEPQLYVDNLMCVSRDALRLLRAAEFTTGYVPAQCFDVACENAMTKMGYTIGLFTPCLYLHQAKNVVVFQHGDDFVVCGTRFQQAEFKNELR